MCQVVDATIVQTTFFNPPPNFRAPNVQVRHLVEEVRSLVLAQWDNTERMARTGPWDKSQSRRNRGY